MDGYTRLAALIGKQNEYGVFRRYLSLRALRLVHLSAEIAHIAEDLGVVAEMHRTSGDPERTLYELHYQSLKDSHGNSGTSAQSQLWISLSERLKEYGEGLLLYRQLAQLPSVDQNHLRNFRAWLKEADGGHRFLHGAEAVLWDVGTEDDLTSLCNSADSQDSVTQAAYSLLLPLYSRVIGQKHKAYLTISDPFTGKKQPTPCYEYSDKVIVKAVDIFSAALASLLPSVSALALYFVHSSLGRLGAIVAFTFIFSTVLCLITNVRRAECFGITAAFSAVLVVFIGNNDGCACGA